MFKRARHDNPGPVGQFRADEVECLVICAENGFLAPTPDTLARLCRLREEVCAGARGGFSADTLEAKRLQFARYLYLVGRISEFGV